jgi:hypothetical protein
MIDPVSTRVNPAAGFNGPNREQLNHVKRAAHFAMTLP